MSKEKEEQKTTIEITQYPLKDVSSSNCPPNNSEGFLFLELPDINSFLYLGGSSSDNFGLYLFDIINSSWSKSELKGDIPSPMNYFAGWYDSPYLFIHGGKSLQENKSLKETYLIDISSMTIHKIFTIEEPSSRYGHSAVKNNDKQAYIFGGCNIGKKNERYLNDLHKMEYKNISVFNENNTNINGASWIVNIQTKGEKPPGRKGYCMQLIESINSLLIYGGELKEKKINDDGIYLYNIDEKEYKKINLKENNCIGFRAYHTMHLNDTNNKIYVIGGINNNKEVLNDIIEVDMSDKENIKMKKIEGNDLLNKRYSHKGCNIFFSGENDLLYHHILILGGKKSENEFYDNNLIDLFIKNNSNSSGTNENNINNNNTNNEDNIKFDIEDIKDEQIEENMDKLLHNNNDKNEYNYNNDNDNENTLPLKLSNDVIRNKKNSIPISNRTVYSNHNGNNNNSNIINNDLNSNNSNYSNKNNIELEKKKKNYLETLIKQQKQYIEMYARYKKINEEYLTNKNTLKELENKEVSHKVMENLNKNKNKEKITKLGKVKGEIATLKKKIKDIKNYNELLNEYMNIYKERFCFLSDFLSDYIEDIMKLDNLLMEYGLNIPGVNYESFSNKRKRYKMLVINLCRDVKVYNIFEKDLYDKLVKLKEFEQGQSENNSYRNTIQKVNKKEETVNMNEFGHIK